MRKLYAGILIFLVVIPLVPFTLPDNHYSNKTRYIITNSDMVSHSVNTFDFSSSGMIYTAFTDIAQNIYYKDINYTNQNNYVIKSAVPSSQSVNLNSFFNKTDCSGYTFTSSSHKQLSCQIYVINYFNFYENNTRLFLIRTEKAGYLVMTNEQGENASIIQVPSLLTPTFESRASSFSITYDFFYKVQNQLVLVYENNTGVIFSFINTSKRSIETKLILKYSDYGIYELTKFNDGKIYVAFVHRIVEVGLQTNLTFNIKNVAYVNNTIINISPFQDGLFYRAWETKYLYYYNSVTNKTLEIHNLPFQAVDDFVALNSSSMFFIDYFQKQFSYITFTYTITSEQSNTTYASIAYYKNTQFEENTTQNKFYFDLMNDIEFFQLGNTGKYFLLSTAISPSGLNIYINKPLTYPSFSLPAFNWIEYTLNLVNLSIETLINNIFIGWLGLFAIIILFFILLVNRFISTANESRIRKKAQKFIDEDRDKTITRDKKVVSICPNCNFAINDGETLCPKCGKSVSTAFPLGHYKSLFKEPKSYKDDKPIN